MNITKIVQIIGVASETEAELETKGMDRCTMTHSNFSMWALCQKWSVAKLPPQNLLLPISPIHALYNFSREHCITSAHMEKLDYFLGSRNQPSTCLNLESSLATRWFTENTSQSGACHMAITWFSDENVVIAKWLPEIDSVKHFSMWNGVLIGTAITSCTDHEI